MRKGIIDVGAGDDHISFPAFVFGSKCWGRGGPEREAHMIDLILDLMFIGGIVIVAIPILAGLYGLFLVLKTLYYAFFKGVWYVCCYPVYWIIHHSSRE